jgi:hypothetical protein
LLFIDYYVVSNKGKDKNKKIKNSEECQMTKYQVIYKKVVSSSSNQVKKLENSLKKEEGKQLKNYTHPLNDIYASIRK